MEITQTLYVATRDEWRQWLINNHATAREIWLIFPSRMSGQLKIPYLEAVEEALCFGWIDGIQKKLDAEHSAQRFTPRRPRSNWTELNKERARRLIKGGQMTEAGKAVLPDLSLQAFQVPEDILQALQADPQTWENYQRFPDLYRRIRIRHIEEVRNNPEVFQKRLANFLKKTRENKTIGTFV
jgi:uncharacterized protein YdeI (YjbR/CyaY-like superfamily)